MDPLRPGQPPQLADLAPELASTVVRVAGDIALVIGDDGVIRSVAEGGVPMNADGQQWVGRNWADTVSGTARPKVERLLQEAQQLGVSRRRELNHPAVGGGEIPVSWAAVRLGEHGPVLAVGRDLRVVGAIQQRFLDAQQDVERDYWQRRQVESHYRLLFQVAHDAVVVLDADTLEVREANPAACTLFGTAELTGHTLRPFIDDRLLAALDELLLTASASGHAAEARLRVAGLGSSIDMSATPFRADGHHCLLLRARRAETSAGDRQDLVGFIDQTPDAVVVTDSIGRVLWANPAFVALCEAPNEARLRGRDIADALGDEWQTWAALLARVRAHGIVGHSTLALRLPGREAAAFDVSAALLAEGDQERIGFTLRSTQSPPSPHDAARLLAQDLSALVATLGKASLGEMLAEAGRMAEMRLLQEALQRSGDRIDVAANLLQISIDTLLLHMTEIGLPLPMPAGLEGQPPSVN